jgi:hypothetical protein
VYAQDPGHSAPWIGRGGACRDLRLALKLDWERGRLTYRNRSNGWNREHRTFALTATTYPALNFNLDRDAATDRLVEAYFDRYGPASLRDVMWWSGLAQNARVAALGRIGRPPEAFTSAAKRPGRRSVILSKAPVSRIAPAGASARIRWPRHGAELTPRLPATDPPSKPRAGHLVREMPSDAAAGGAPCGTGARTIA